MLFINVVVVVDAGVVSEVVRAEHAACAKVASNIIVAAAGILFAQITAVSVKHSCGRINPNTLHAFRVRLQ